MNKESSLLKQLETEIRVKPTWSKDELELKIKRKREAASSLEENQRVKEIKKYDFFGFKLLDIPHPCVIFRIEDGVAWGILVSTSVSHHNIDRIQSSRQMDGAFWSNVVICQPVDLCLKHWLGIFENGEEVDRAVGLLKPYYERILTL